MMPVVEKTRKIIAVSSRKDLLCFGRKLEYPFSIILQDGTDLVCEKSLRILPGKRLTLQGKWKDKNVVAKIFLAASGAKRHAARDYLGIKTLHTYKLNAPEILYNGKSKCKDMHILIYEFITSSQKVKQSWEQAKSLNEQKDLISKLAQTLARQHTVGLWQSDLHLNNFLLKRGKIYCLDGDGIRFRKKTKSLSLNKSFYNLAMLIEHLTNYNTEHVKTVFLEYCAYRNIPVTENYYDKLLLSMDAVRNRLNKKQMEKTLRDCSSFVCRKTNAIFQVYDRDYDVFLLKPYFDHPERFFEISSLTYLKKGRVSSVIKVQLEDFELVIKRYNIKNLLHGVKTLFKSISRARRSWLSAHYLKLLNVNTIKPVALYESKISKLQFKSYFISEFLPAKNIVQFTMRYEHELSLLKPIADSLIMQLQRLYTRSVTHGDLKATNILVHKNQVIFLDLDTVTWHKSQYRFERAKQEDLQRFLRNFVHNEVLYAYWQKRIKEEFE